jgi:hypothetical protein
MNNMADYEKNVAVKKLIKDVEKRLEERIIGLNLLTDGDDGAREYLARFGKGISASKCAAFAIVCTRRADRKEALCGLDAIATKKNLIAFAARFENQVEVLGGLS